MYHLYVGYTCICVCLQVCIYVIKYSLLYVIYDQGTSISHLSIAGMFCEVDVICPIVFNFFLQVLLQFLTFLLSVCEVSNEKYFNACLPDQLLNQVKFCFVFVGFLCCSTNYFVIKNLTLSSLLPLISAFFLLLITSLYLFVIVSYFHFSHSYQVNINIIFSIISFVNFLIYTFAFYL